jgi:hypothetical protein
MVTAFGSHESRSRLIDALNEGADEPTAEISLDDLSAALVESEAHRPDEAD